MDSWASKKAQHYFDRPLDGSWASCDMGLKGPQGTSSLRRGLTRALQDPPFKASSLLDRSHFPQKRNQRKKRGRPPTIHFQKQTFIQPGIRINEGGPSKNWKCKEMNILGKGKAFQSVPEECNNNDKSEVGGFFRKGNGSRCSSPMQGLEGS